MRAARPRGILASTQEVNVNRSPILMLALVAAGALVAYGSLEARDDPPPRSSALLPLAAEPAEEPAPETVFRPVAALASRRESLAPAAAPIDEVDADEAAQGPGEARFVSGRVLDAEANAVADVPVGPKHGDEQVRSDPAGRFTLELASRGGEIVAKSDEWVTVGAGAWPGTAAVEPTVVVARALTVAGRVVDGSGAGLANVVVRLQLPLDFAGRFDFRSERTIPIVAKARSAPDGTFRIERCPAIEGATLFANHEGYRTAEVPLPRADDERMELVLERPATAAEGALRGRVYTPNGVPVPGARVAVGLTTVPSDADGYFEVDLARAVTAHRIVAAKRGFLPATVERETYASGPDGEWPDFVDVYLGAEPLSIAGVLKGPDREPIADAMVWIADPTPLGVAGMSPLQIESLLAGGEVLPEAVGTAQELPAEDGDHTWDRGRVLDEPSALWHWVRTDAEGRFLLEGLLDRDYHVKAFDPKTLLATTSRPIPAGTPDARIAMPKDALYAKLAGRVVDPRGEPCRGATLHLEHRAFETTARVFGGTLTFATLEGRDSATADEDGRFTFTNVPKTGIRLTVMGDDVVPKTVDLDEGIDPTNVAIEVDVRRHFKLELDDPTTRADGLRARDASGDPVEIWQIGAKNRDAYGTVPIESGRSPVLSVSARATELLLVKNSAVVGSIPLNLSGGGVTVLRY